MRCTRIKLKAFVLTDNAVSSNVDLNCGKNTIFRHLSPLRGLLCSMADRVIQLFLALGVDDDVLSLNIHTTF